MLAVCWTLAQASAHLHSKVQVTQSDDLRSTSGFNSDNDPTWTQGDGYIPLSAHDTVTGEMRSFDLYDSDKLSTVALDIPSLGKMIRAGWSFYFESVDNFIALTPDKQSHFSVDLGDDDILRLRMPHELRSGRKAPVTQRRHWCQRYMLNEFPSC